MDETQSKPAEPPLNKTDNITDNYEDEDDEDTFDPDDTEIV